MAKAKDLQAEYEARLLATSSNLLRFFDQGIGIINSAQGGDMPDETAFTELQTLYETWSKIIVDDLAPKEHIIHG